MKKIKEALLKLIKIAEINGLHSSDLKSAQDYLLQDEFGLCFELLVTQMYEYDIEIDNEGYALITEIGEMMNLESDNYSFMKELIRSG